MHLLHSPFIQNWLHEHFNIILISGIHLTKGEMFGVLNFITCHNAYSTVEYVKTCGGISYHISLWYLYYVKNIVTDIPENISSNLKKQSHCFPFIYTRSLVVFTHRL